MEDKTEQRMYDLLGLKLTGDATTEDLQDLENLLTKYPEYRFLHDELMKPDYDQEAAQDHALQAYAVQYYGKICLNTPADEKTEPYSDLSGEKERRKSGRSLVRDLVLVAVPLFIGCILFWFLRKDNNNSSEGKMAGNTSEMITQKGSKSKILLPDGTTVLLNADSKISYSKSFDVKSRVVTLTGEAYFDVVHNAESPFIIHTEKADVRVLGTVVNVRAYPGEPKFEASLIRGKVEVQMKNNDKAFVLQPSEKIVVSKIDTKEFQVTTVTQLDSTVAETAWVNGQLSFVDEPFSAIASELERQYNVNIEFRNTTAMNYRYTGIFDRTRIEDILNVLKIIKPFKYTIADNRVIIY